MVMSQPHQSLLRQRTPEPSGLSVENDFEPHPPPSEYESLSGILHILRRRWKTVVFFGVGTFVLGVLACLLITPKYSSTVVIEINKQEHSENVSADSTSTAATADELKAEIATDMTVLQSDGLALDVISELNLTTVRPFDKAVISAEKGKPLDQVPLTREKLLKVFAKNLTVESPPDTRLVNITFQNPDPTIAANVANALSKKFIEGSMDRRHRSTIQSTFWLKKELEDLKKQVEDSEQKLADYQRTTGLAGIELSAPGTGNTGGSPHSTVAERLFSLNQELTAAESNRISTEAIYHLVQTQDPEVVLGLGSMSISSGVGGGGTSLTADGGIQLIRSLRTQEAALTQEYAGSAVKYGANNPRLVQTQQQLDAVRQQMHAELGRISKRAENAYNYAKRNEDTIRQAFVKQQDSANEMADDVVHLQVLAQEAYSNRALYEGLFSRLQTASLASGVRATQLDVVDEARAAGTASVPNVQKVLLILASLAIFLGISSAFVQESLDETVRRPRDLKECLDGRMLGYVPEVMLGYVPEVMTRGSLGLSGGDSELIDEPRAPFSESFRVLRTSVVRAMSSLESNTLLVTSAAGGEGKTTVVYNLGVALAQQGARVLLVDCNLRTPDLHRLFGSNISPGMSELNAVGSDITDLPIVRHGSLSNLELLPAGAALEFPAEFFESRRFDAVLNVCAAHYDYVLLDSPPILSVTDASILASKVGASLGVLRSAITTRAALISLMEQLKYAKTPIVGVMLNGVRNPKMNGFYEYSYCR